MNNENKHSPIIISRLKYKTLLDFGFKKQSTKIFQKKLKIRECPKTLKFFSFFYYFFLWIILILWTVASIFKSTMHFLFPNLFKPL